MKRITTLVLLVLAATMLSANASLLSKYTDAKQAYETNQTAQTLGAYSTNYYNYAINAVDKIADTNKTKVSRVEAWVIGSKFLGETAVVTPLQDASVRGALYTNSVSFLMDQKYSNKAESRRQAALEYNKIYRFVQRHKNSFPSQYSVFTNYLVKVEVENLLRSDYRLVQNLPLLNTNVCTLLKAAKANAETNGLAQAAVIFEGIRTNYPAEYGIAIGEIRKARLKASRVR